MVCDDGETARVKLVGGGVTALTTRLTMTPCDNVPLVPVSVMRCVPVGVDGLVSTVTVDEPDPVTDGGLNVTLVPLGAPLELKFTVPVKPLSAVTVAV